MKINFITGNNDKFEQARLVFNDIEHELLFYKFEDIPELQSLNGNKVIREKINFVLKTENPPFPFLVEDTSLRMDALNGFPGPLAKHFYLAIGADGMVDVAQKFNILTCQAITRIAFCERKNDEPYYFASEIKGKLQKSSVYLGHGFEDVFVPEGYNLSLSEMDPIQRATINMRGMVFSHFKNFIKERYPNV